MRFRFCGDLDCPDWVLSEVATLSRLSSVRIKVIVQQILRYCLEGSFNYEKVLKLAADNADGISDMKGSIAAIHFMITNAAKHDVDDQSLVQEIQQLGLPKENSENIGRAYRDHKDALRQKFADESYQISRLLQSDWRVDQIVSSSTGSSGPLVQLKFVVDTQPHLGGGSAAAVDGDRCQEFAFELSSDKLDVLIHELSRASAMLQGLQS